MVGIGAGRAEARRRRSHVAIYSRNGNDKTRSFPASSGALGESLAARSTGRSLLDGEIVAIDADGRPLGFQHIQGRIHLTARGRHRARRARRSRPRSSSSTCCATATKTCAASRSSRAGCGCRSASGPRAGGTRARPPQRDRARRRPRDAARARATEGWEGLIVKDGQSLYHSGTRTPAWRKLKLLKQQEFVVGGWTEPRQSRTHFGALLLGYYDEHGALRWAGSGRHRLRPEGARSRRASCSTRARAPKSPFADAVQDGRDARTG